MIVYERQGPPAGYRDRFGDVIRRPLPLAAPRKPVDETPSEPPPVSGDAGDRPAWLDGLPDPPRKPHTTSIGRDRQGRYLPKPWFPHEIKTPSRAGTAGTRTPTHFRRCRHCGQEFTGFHGQVWCSRKCRNAAFYTRERLGKETVL